MNFDQAMQMLAVLGGIVTTAATARWGHKQLTAKMDKDNASILAKLERDYVTLEAHRSSMTTIHADKNKLAEEVAYLKGESAAKKLLDDKQSAEIDFLKAAFLATASRNETPPKV